MARANAFLLCSGGPKHEISRAEAQQSESEERALEVTVARAGPFLIRGPDGTGWWSVAGNQVGFRRSSSLLELRSCPFDARHDLMSQSRPFVQSGDTLDTFLRSFWQRQIDAAEQETPDVRHPPLPLARIKKVMKSDPEVKVSASQLQSMPFELTPCTPDDRGGRYA